MGRSKKAANVKHWGFITSCHSPALNPAAPHASQRLVSEPWWWRCCSIWWWPPLLSPGSLWPDLFWFVNLPKPLSPQDVSLECLVLPHGSFSSFKTKSLYHLLWDVPASPPATLTKIEFPSYLWLSQWDDYQSSLVPVGTPHQSPALAGGQDPASSLLLSSVPRVAGAGMRGTNWTSVGKVGIAVLFQV